MTPFDVFLLIATAHVPILCMVYVITTLLVLKTPHKYGGRSFALLFTAECLLDLLIMCFSFLTHRLPAFSLSAQLFPSTEPPAAFRLSLAFASSLPFLHDAVSLKLLHHEIPQQDVRIGDTALPSLSLHLLLSSLLSLLIFLLSLFTPLSVHSCSFPFDDAHFLLPSTGFGLLPPSPLPLFILLSTVLSTVSIGLISHRTLSSSYTDTPLQRGPLALREDRWIQNLQRMQRSVSCMHYVNLLYIGMQMLNLRPGVSPHLPAGLYLNGFIVELKIFSTLLMFIYDHTKLSTVLLRILDLCPANHYSSGEVTPDEPSQL